MNRSVRMVAVATTVAVVLGGSAGASVGAKAKKVSPEKYAKNLCGAHRKTIDRFQEFVDAYNAFDGGDNVALQAETVELTNDLLADLKAVRTKLKKSYPDVDGGRTIAKSFVSNLAEISTKLQKALEKYQAADANDAAFLGDSAQFEVAINTLTVGLSDPFIDVDDQDLLTAFDDEKSCKGIVKIFSS